MAIPLQPFVADPLPGPQPVDVWAKRQFEALQRVENELIKRIEVLEAQVEALQGGGP